MPKPKPKVRGKKRPITKPGKMPNFHYKTRCTIKGCTRSIKRGDEIWSYSIKDKPKLGIVGRCKKHRHSKFDKQETNRASADRSPW
jgi:hypothetical protein